MGTQLTRILLPLLLIGGCSQPLDATPDEKAISAREKTTDQASLGGARTALVAQDDTCLLRHAGQPDTPLAPAPPCRFLRVDGQVQQHAYPDRGIDAVVLVVGTPAEATRKAHFGIPATMACGTVAHGLIVRGDKVSAARQPQREGMFCVDRGRDEKDFYAVAHER